MVEEKTTELESEMIENEIYEKFNGEQEENTQKSGKGNDGNRNKNACTVEEKEIYTKPNTKKMNVKNKSNGNG